ncbi:MAG: YkvA family protein [Candidatus Cloacimonadaceae bacterium]|nr:YkvA family protein [Candidatus Cloacimonadaceae bacterium]
MKDDVLYGKEMPESKQEKLKERIVDIDDKKMKFYEELRKKAKDWTKLKSGSLGGKLSEYLFLLPDFFILVSRLALDKRVPAKRKLLIGGIIAYLIMPFDIIPDMIPVIGHIDDLVMVVLGLNLILNDTDPKVLRDNWSGDGDVLDQIKKITAVAEKFLDKTILSRIKGWLGTKS